MLDPSIASAHAQKGQPLTWRTATIPEPLIDREIEILERIAAGSTNLEIAEALFMLPQTVKKLAANVYARLGLHSRIETAARARQLALLKQSLLQTYLNRHRTKYPTRLPHMGHDRCAS
jgi:DNA-binding NarL/FixJ family response regulator